MNYYLKELNKIDILGAVIQKLCKKYKVFETAIYFEEILIQGLDKASW